MCKKYHRKIVDRIKKPRGRHGRKAIVGYFTGTHRLENVGAVAWLSDGPNWYFEWPIVNLRTSRSLQGNRDYNVITVRCMNLVSAWASSKRLFKKNICAHDIPMWFESFHSWRMGNYIGTKPARPTRTDSTFRSRSVREKTYDNWSLPPEMNGRTSSGIGCKHPNSN